MITSARRTREIVANMRIIWKEPLLLVAILAIFYFLILFVAFPIFQVFRYSLVIDKHFDISNYLAVFSARYYYQPFLNHRNNRDDRGFYLRLCHYPHSPAL